MTRIFERASLTLLTNKGLTEDWKPEMGFHQGLSTSPLFFNYGIEVATSIFTSQAKNRGIVVEGITIYEGAYADDIKIVTTGTTQLESDVARIIKILEELLLLPVNYDKTEYIRPAVPQACIKEDSRNFIQVGPHRIYKKRQGRYLGHSVGYQTRKDNKGNHIRCQDSTTRATINKAKQAARDIRIQGRSSKNKRILMRACVTSKIAHAAQMKPIEDGLTDELAASISNTVKRAELIQYCAPKEAIFISENKGGYGYTHPEHVTLETFINTSMYLLNDSERECKELHRKLWDRNEWMELDECLKKLNLNISNKTIINKTSIGPRGNIENNDVIWTDGSWQPKKRVDKIGGAAVITRKGIVVDTLKFKFDQGQDNAFAELYTVAALLWGVPENIRLEIKTDYMNLVRAMTQGIAVKDAYKPILKYIKRVMVTKQLHIKWTHVEAHTGIANNESADQSAKEATINGTDTYINKDILEANADEWFVTQEDCLWPSVKEVTGKYVQEKLMHTWKTKCKDKNLDVVVGRKDLHWCSFNHRKWLPDKLYRHLIKAQCGYQFFRSNKDGATSTCQNTHCFGLDLTLKHLLWECKTEEELQWFNTEVKDWIDNGAIPIQVMTQWEVGEEWDIDDDSVIIMGARGEITHKEFNKLYKWYGVKTMERFGELQKILATAIRTRMKKQNFKYTLEEVTVDNTGALEGEDIHGSGEPYAITTNGVRRRQRRRQTRL
jgi:ribonuclease HI